MRTTPSSLAEISTEVLKGLWERGNDIVCSWTMKEETFHVSIYPQWLTVTLLIYYNIHIDVFAYCYVGTLSY